MKKLREKYQSECIRFPKPIIWNNEVLIETLETGMKIDDFIKEYPSRAIRTRSLRLACYMSMAWYHNLLHADMHSGNLLYDIDDESGKTYVTILDAGVVASLDDSDDMRGLMNSILTLNSEDITRFILKHNKNPNANTKRFYENIHECTERLNKMSSSSSLDILLSKPGNIERFFGDKTCDVKHMKALTLSMDNTMEFIQFVSKSLYTNSIVVDGNMLCFFLGFAIAYGPKMEGCNLLKEAIRIAIREKMCGDREQMKEWMGCDITMYIEMSDKLETVAKLLGIENFVE